MASENTRRIAKNTAMLYIRMLLMMAVTLYTSRVILQILGVEDYGIFNVVGGVVVVLGFLNSSLSGASSRFLTYSLGKGNQDDLKQMFSAVLLVHIIMALLVVLLGETVGLWFVLHKMVIPPERMTAALWVYHCSILTAVVSFISVPYNALIIAHERMNAFAYISIMEVVLKLLIVYLLTCLPFDKLIVYAVLYLIVQIFVQLFYRFYCTKHFPASRSVPAYYPEQMKKIFSYAVWTMNGNLAVVGYTQGINLLLNMFFGPVVNAARGIAVQVQHAIITFVQNFQTAIRPQIIKSYAISDLEYMHSLVIALSKYGSYLMMVVSFPLLLCVEPVLHFWLGIVPEYTVSFVRIMLMISMLQSIGCAMITAIHATGDLRKFQLYEGTSLLTVVPICFLFLKVWHVSPDTVMLIYFFVELFTSCVRIWIVVPKIKMQYRHYLNNAVLPLFLPLICMAIPLFFVQIRESTLIELIQYIILACVYIAVCIFLFGLNRRERRVLWNYVIKIKRKTFVE